MSKGRILVTPRSLSKAGHPALDKLTDAGFEVVAPFPGKQPEEDDLLAVLPGCVGYLAGVEKISAAVLKASPSLKVVSRNGVGVDNIDAEAARTTGIEVCITAGANSRGVAELAVGLIFSAMRSLPQVNASVKRGGWERTKGREVYGRTLGIVGMGQIGRLVASMAIGMNMKVLGYDLCPNAEFESGLSDFRYVEMSQLISNCDIITLHCPAGESPLVNTEFLSDVMPGTVLINTARSALVDQNAVLDALNKGIVAAYAVDAFESEPPEMTALFKHPNVIMSAHIGGFTEESVDRATTAAVENLLKVLGG